MQTNFKASLLFFAVMMFAVVSVAYPAQVEPRAETVMETPTETQSHNPSPTTMPTSTPTPQPTRTPTQIPTPSFTPTPSESPTPLPPAITSPEWVEYAPGSASGQGISQGFGNPRAFNGVRIVMDKDDIPVFYWDSPRSGSRAVHALKRVGETWEELGKGLITKDGIFYPAGINALFLDPADNNLVLSCDYYSNSLYKYLDSKWVPWLNGHANSYFHYNFWTDVAFLLDYTPVAILHVGNLPTISQILVDQFSGASWSGVPGISGLTQERDLEESQEGFIHPRLMVSPSGVIFALLRQVPDNGMSRLYVKEWRQDQWVTIFSSETTTSDTYAWWGLRPACFDSRGNLIITYQLTDTAQSTIQVKKWENGEWTPMGSSDGINDPGTRGYMPILTMTAWDSPVVLWGDHDSHGLYAKYFDGQEWRAVGEGATIAQGIDRIVYANFDAVINQDNELIVAYVSDDYSNNIYVKKHQLTPPAEYVEPTPTPTPSPIPGWFVLDGFGGIHSSNPELDRPVLPYFLPYNIVRDLEPDPQGRGWYMLDGCGGIHTSSPDLPKPVDLPYFGFDIARNLEIRDTGNGYVFYLLDGYGVVHTTDSEFEQGELPWFGFDNACDLEPHPNGKGWLVLDRYGIAFSSVDLMENYPMNAVWPAPLVRAMTVFPDHTYAVMDAFAGRHTNPRKPARDVVHGLPEDFYFWGFDIIWDMEPVYPGKE